MLNLDRNSAIAAVIILNYLIPDFVIGTNVFIEYRERYKLKKINDMQLSAVEKMCFSHLALSLFTLLEFWDQYHQLLSRIHHANLKKLTQEIRKKGVEDFRNKFSAHLLDKKTKEPLRPSEIMNSLERLTGGHIDNFLNWINSPSNNTYPYTVVSIVETIRDSLSQEYCITPDEIINAL